MIKQSCEVLPLLSTELSPPLTSQVIISTVVERPSHSSKTSWVIPCLQLQAENSFFHEQPHITE